MVNYLITCFLCLVNLLVLASIILLLVYVIKTYIFLINNKNKHSFIKLKTLDKINTEKFLITKGYKNKNKELWMKANILNTRFNYIKINNDSNNHTIETWYRLKKPLNYDYPLSKFSPSSHPLKKDIEKIIKLNKRKH